MNYKIVNGSISYGADTIIEEINIEIKDKDKIAIVGRNGCGKSTLLKGIIFSNFVIISTSSIFERISNAFWI